MAKPHIPQKYIIHCVTTLTPLRRMSQAVHIFHFLLLYNEHSYPNLIAFVIDTL